MAEAITLARPYAEAVFRLADEKGTLPAWAKTLMTMATVAANPDTRECIGNPKLSSEQLYGLFMSLCGDGVAQEAQNFVRILIDNRRLILLPEIHEQFEYLKNERERVLQAQIYTAFTLEESQKAELISVLEARYKREIDAHVSVDEDLIGGVRIVVGDEVIDGSVRSKLNAAAAALQG